MCQWCAGKSANNEGSNAARRVAQIKPVVVLKSARTEGGRRVTNSHTGSQARPDEMFDATCRQSGLVRADRLQDLYDTGRALATMREHRGNRLLVVSTSGGGAALAVDEFERRGLVIPPFLLV